MSDCSPKAMKIRNELPLIDANSLLFSGEKRMEYRIDGAVTPPGLIASAKTFSLILRDEGLYVIHTGPEMQVQQKHSKLLTADQISEINIKENRREIVLEIRSSQGKYKFRLPLEDRDTAEMIKQNL